MTNDTAAGTDRSFLFVLASSRSDGNTEILARAAAEQLPPGMSRSWVDLNRIPLADFQDGRHDEDTWPAGEGEEKLLAATLAATDVVIVSPLYWYTVSAQAKRYLDHWSRWLRVPGADFRARMAGRTLWGVTVMAHTEEEVADGMVTTLNNSAAYMRMRFGGVLFGNGSAPGQVRDDARALERAKTFFHRDAPLARFPYEAAVDAG
ncbi:flavodoxin family protein [Kitasatospora sp. NPDC090091]|uniref:flavodoxin family protein n=1 Tax=Kitasatospora sp. NPDC090091 TaxID=3364081 RepID=UPI0038076D95